MGLIERFNKPEETPLHSTGYGQVAGQDGSAVGDVGLSMEKRKEIEKTRQFVNGYTRSGLGAGYVPPEARHYKPRAAPQVIGGTDTGRGSLTDQTSRRQAMNAGEQLPNPGRLSTGFREPPTRSYNPYS